MPRVIAQESRRADPVAADGSILSRAVDVSTVRTSWVKMLLYGQNGTGKTHLACTFPKPLLLLSFEPDEETGGAITVRNFKGVKWLQRGKHFTKMAEVDALAAEMSESSPFATVVFDSVTSMQEMVLEEILGHEVPAELGFGQVSDVQYRQRARQCKSYLRPWVNLRCNTVFVGKEKDHNPPEEKRVSEKTGKLQPDLRPKFVRGMQKESFVSVDLGGGTAGWLADSCNYICRLYFDREIETTTTMILGKPQESTHETGRFVRCLRTSYHPNFAARFRADAGTVPEQIVEPSYEKIAAVIEGRAGGKK